LKEQHPVIAQIEKADKDIVAEDFDTFLDIYADDALLVVEPGRNTIGKVAIKKAFEAIAVFFKNGFRVSQEGLAVLESGETALVMANTAIYPMPDSRKPMLFIRKQEQA